MEDKRNIDKLLQSGIAAQTEKLLENSEKRGFDNIDIDYGFKRLQDEYLELFDELYYVKKRDPHKIRREAADVANFAHMIIFACDKLI